MGTNTALEQPLFARAGVKQSMRQLPEPEWPFRIRQMRRPGADLKALWREYRATHPPGSLYSRF